MDTFASTVRDLGMEAECPCIDPECAAMGGMMEPDSDGDHQMMECRDCGYVGYYTKMPTSVLAEDADGNCSIGVPSEIRRAASSPLERAMETMEAQNPKPVDLGLTIGRRPGI